MDPLSLAAFTAALALAVASPGPGITAVVARALGVGFRRTLPMVAGLVAGDLCYLSFAAFGLAALAQSFGIAFVVVKYLGAAYLLYLAVKLWRAPGTVGPVDADGRAGDPLRAFLAGFAITLGNPKVIVFYLALLPSIVDLENLTPLGFAELAAVVVAVLTAIAVAYAAAADRARLFFRSPKAMRLLNRGAGTMMAGAAVAVAAR